MNKRNGFVFVETIIVITILVTALLLIYASFTSVLTNEKERVKYDDISYIYRTMYLTNFLEDNNIQVLYNEVDRYNFTSFNCNYSGLIEDEDIDVEDEMSTLSFCEAMLSELNVNHLYMTHYDVSGYKGCKNHPNNGICPDLTDVDEDMITYIHSLRSYGDTLNGYRLLASYYDKKIDENNCYKSENGECLVYNNQMSFYSSLKPVDKSRKYDYYKVDIEVENGYTFLNQNRVNAVHNHSVEVAIYPNTGYAVTEYANVQCSNGQNGYISTENGKSKLKILNITSDTSCTVTLGEANPNIWYFTECGKEIAFNPPTKGMYKVTTYGGAGGAGSKYTNGIVLNEYGVNTNTCVKNTTYEMDNEMSSGIFKLNKTDPVYVYVGCNGEESITSDDACATYQSADGGAGGWNGGIKGTSIGEGGTGGATHVSLSKGNYSSSLLDNSNLLLVAAGGSGFKYENIKLERSTQTKVNENLLIRNKVIDEHPSYSKLAVIEYISPVYDVKIKVLNGQLKKDDANWQTGDLDIELNPYLITPSVSIKNNTGYHFDSVTCTNGQSVAVNNDKLDFSGINQSTTCTVNYAINTYSVQLKVSNGTGATTKTVNYNSKGTFTSSPTTGYHYSSISCTNGQTASLSGSTVTTGKITNNTVCTLSYVINTYTVTFKPNNTNYGTVANASKTVNHGSSTSTTFSAKTGYHYSGLSCTGGSVSGSTVTVSNVTSNITCTVNFAINSYTVTFKSNNTNYGTVANASKTANHGSSTSTTFSAKTGYHYASLSCTGGSVSGSTVTVSNVTSNITCTVNFAINTYTVTFNVTSGTGATSKTVNYGSTTSITSAPNTNYAINTYNCNNNVSLTKSGNTFTTGAITANTTCTIAYKASCAYNVGQTWDYGYTGGIQSFTVPCNGTYQLEVWGAQGGTPYGDDTGGYGGKSSGNQSFNQGTVLYIGVGGQGQTGDASISYGGFNGGGDGAWGPGNKGGWVGGSGGGGATHIGLSNATLKNTPQSQVYIVAGGGGGWGRYYNQSTGGLQGEPIKGGAGGGLVGGSGIGGTYGSFGGGGTQTEGGTRAYAGTISSGSYGQGGSGDHTSYDGTANTCHLAGSGGGGGWYGGAHCLNNAALSCGGGGGGSGYIGGVTNGSMQTGVQSGNGYARITLVTAN